MKKSMKAFIGAVCLVFCLVMLAGCGDEEASNSPTPKPTANTGGTAQNPYLRPRDESLKNAIKTGENYRYFVWTTNDPANPFEEYSDEDKDFALNRKSNYEREYGITIEYVQTVPDWSQSFAQAAYSGQPLADVFNAGGPFTMYANYNYQNTPGSVLEPLSNYSEYADFNDSEWFDTNSQKVTTFNNQLYFAVPNPVGIDAVSLNQVVIFNKEILTQNGISDKEVYEMYKNGTWNWEAFKDIAIGCTDLDNEVYGVHMGENNSLMWGLVPSNNAFLLSQTVDSTGKAYYEFTGDSANALEAWDFFIQLARADAVLMSMSPTEDIVFRSGKAAMISTYVNRAGKITNYRQYPQFGIVTVPKGPKAENYVSSCNWFTPFCVFKGTANPAGSVQVLSEYCAPRYAKNSEEAKAQFEAGAMKIVCDSESIEVLRSIPEISVTEPYIIYWNSPSFSTGDSEIALCNLYWNYNEAFVDGSQTPAVLFESLKGALNETLKSAQAVIG